MNNQNPYEENLQNVLEKYGRDITQEAKDGKIDPVIGRDEEIRNITRILSRKTKNNPVLVGVPGVGKTAIIEGLATRIIKGDIPNNLKDKTGELQEKKDNKIKGVVNLEINRRGIKSWKILKHYNFF